MKLVLALLAISAVTLGIGLTAPTMEIEPRLAVYGGDYTEVMTWLFPREFTASSYSIVDGIAAMWADGSRGLAGLIFAFSVVFPIAKILVLWWAAQCFSERQLPGKSLHFVEKLGKFSMIDVFVISLLVVTIKGLPGGSQIHAQWGIIVFSISVILSIIAGFLISRARL